MKILLYPKVWIHFLRPYRHYMADLESETPNKDFMGWIVSPQIYILKSQSPVPCKEMVFGDKAFKEVIKLKWGHWCEALIQYDCCSYKKGKETPGMHAHRGMNMWRHSRKVVICKPMGEASEELNRAATLILES